MRQLPPSETSHREKWFVWEILLKCRTKGYQVVETYTNLFTTPPKRRILTLLLGGRSVVMRNGKNIKSHTKRIYRFSRDGAVRSTRRT